MVRTSNSAGTKSGATVSYKVKKLTPRRIKVIKEFLTRTIDCPENVVGFFGSGTWMDMLIAFLREPKRCRSTRMDIVAWLKDECFEELIDQVDDSAAQRDAPPSSIFQSGSMKRSISLIKVEPGTSGETFGVGAIKTEMVDVKQEVEDQGVENVGPGEMAGNQDQEEVWGIKAIKEEAEIVYVTDEIDLDDGLEKQHPMPGVDHDHCYDLSFKRSEGSIFMDELRESGPTKASDQGVAPEDPLGDSSAGYSPLDPFEEEILRLTQAPPPSPPTGEDGGGGEGEGETDQERKEFMDLFKILTEVVDRKVQEKKQMSGASGDWDTISFAMGIVKNQLEQLEKFAERQNID